MTLALTALLLLSVQPAPQGTLRELNARGLSAYRKGQLEEAAQNFEAALRAAPAEPGTVKEQVAQTRALAFAHYNLACALALLRQAGRLCLAENYRSNIITHLHQALRLEPSRLERAVRDPDLRVVQDTLGFQSLLGLSPREEKALPLLLQRVRWFSPGLGAAGSLSQTRFLKNGRVEVVTQRFDDSGNKQAPLRVLGRWRLEGRALRVNWPDGKVSEGTFAVEGYLFLDGKRWSDEPTECDA